MGHAPLVQSLADRLRRRAVRQVTYFHTDHFEPWRPVRGLPAVGQEVVDSLHGFLRATERLEYARRLTLFYKPHLNYALGRNRAMQRAHPDDLVGFLPRAEFEDRFGRAAMRPYAEESGHEIQLHIHHEYYTATTAHTDPVAIEWFSTALGKSLDEQRLDLALRLNREIIARETGRPLDRWFFVHGQWALNASDDYGCTIVNEIDLLRRHGCLGDFTFPAGRPKVNPRQKIPYLCRPVGCPKGYDLPEAEPEPAAANRAAAAEKFFIWSCSASSLHCSLDSMSETSRRHLANTRKAAEALIDGSYLLDGQLFIKTHAHSMHPHYFDTTDAPVVPHQTDAVRTLLGVILDAAAKAGANVEFRTASEVYDRVLDAVPGVRPEPGRDRAPLSVTETSPPDLETARTAFMARLPARIDMVRRTASRVLTERIERLGPVRSGAHEHYGQILELGFPLPNHDLAALDIVLRHVPPLACHHEIGSGMGVLPILLALYGRSAIGFEADRGRHETAVAIWQEIATAAGLPPDLCRFHQGLFPTVPRRRERSDAIAIFANLSITMTQEAQDDLMRNLRDYRYVLVNTRWFCELRSTPEKRQVLIEKLAALGFTVETEVSDPADNDYHYALLRNAASTGVPRRLMGSAWVSRLGRRVTGAPS